MTSGTRKGNQGRVASLSKTWQKLWNDQAAFHTGNVCQVNIPAGAVGTKKFQEAAADWEAYEYFGNSTRYIDADSTRYIHKVS